MGHVYATAEGDEQPAQNDEQTTATTAGVHAILAARTVPTAAAHGTTKAHGISPFLVKNVWIRFANAKP
jgi:hypothetical protein